MSGNGDDDGAVAKPPSDRVTDAYYGAFGRRFGARTRERIDWICSRVEGQRVLDIGCSQGVVPILLGRRGFEVIGIDRDTKVIREAEVYLAREPVEVQRRVQFVAGDAESYTGDGEFETVVLTEVLEHLVEPERFLAIAKRHLKRGGRVIVTVPFAINDFPDHKHTFYLLEPYRLLARYFEPVEVKFFDHLWLGLVGLWREGALDDDRSLPIDLVGQLEKAFHSVERELRDRVAPTESARRSLDDSMATLERRLYRSERRLAEAGRLIELLKGESVATADKHRSEIERNKEGRERLAVELKKTRSDRDAALRELAETRSNLGHRVRQSLTRALHTFGSRARNPMRSPRELVVPKKRVRRSALAESEAKRALLRADRLAPRTELPQPAAPLPERPTVVACILDEFSYALFAPEADFRQLTPSEWKDQLSEWKPDLLLVESAWRGHMATWGAKVGHNSQELQDILIWCRDQGVPTAFWNKEDPAHFSSFVNAARAFDYIFTTDLDCIPLYKEALGHGRVYLLPFACQPRINNPLEILSRKDAISFAGSYYARYPERARNLETLLDTLSQSRPVEIFDRSAGQDDPNFQFPERYRPHIIGSLPFDQIDRAYKGYRYGINLNSIKQSQTMFARRVPELLASNTLTVSNFSRSVRTLFGDLLISTDNQAELRRRFGSLLDDHDRADRVRLLALRKMLTEHTYGRRLDYIWSKVTGRPISQGPTSIGVLAKAADEAQAERILRQFACQTYPNLRLWLILPDHSQREAERVTFLSSEWLAGHTLGEVVENVNWLAAMHPDDHYGRNYFTDLALGATYNDATAIGKAAYFEGTAGAMILRSPDAAYRAVDSVPMRQGMVRMARIASDDAERFLEEIEAGTIRGEVLSIDPYNYCRNASRRDTQSITQHVDDLPGIDVGISIDELQVIAEGVPPAKVPTTDERMISPAELAALFGRIRSPKVKRELHDGGLKITSSLADGAHYYIYAREDKPVKLLASGNRLRLHLDVTPGLNLGIACLFLDEAGQRVDTVIWPANRNMDAPVPPNTVSVRLGLRVYAGGVADVRGLVLGHRQIRPRAVVTRSRYLLITNIYPAYEDQYRNAFVHSRVKGYRQSGCRVDVFRFDPRHVLSFGEFEDVDVVSGGAEVLESVLASRRYEHILVHFLSPEMWQVLKQHIDRIAVTVWIHGAEVQPWSRRDYNYTTDEQRKAAIAVSNQRQAFWRGILQPMPENLYLVFVSEYFRQEVLGDLAITLPPGKSRIIHNAIDIDLFSYIEKPAEQRKSILSIRPYASRKYANDISVAVILELSQRSIFDDLDFHLVGDGVLFEETTAPVEGLPNVIIERRFLSQAEIAALHRHYGIFLCPTRMDAQGVSRDEAMASGLVPATNRVAAIPEFVDEECGLLAPAENAIALADGIERLYRDPSLFQVMSRKAAERVRRQSGPDQTIARELALFRID